MTPSIDAIVDEKVNYMVAKAMEKVRKELSTTPAHELSDWIRGRQVMEQFDITTHTLGNWRTRYNLTCSRPNGDRGEIFYRRSELIKLLQDNLLNEE